MRILFVHSRMVGGGIERVTLTLIEEFQKRGIECCLALRHANGDFIGEAHALVEVVELAGSGMHRFVPRLSGLIRDFEPTHIVTAMPDVSLLTLVARWRASSSASVIQGVHVTQLRAAYAKSVFGWLKGTLERLIAGFAYRYVDEVVAVSRGIQEELPSEFGVTAGRIWHIHNPVVRESDVVKSNDIPPSAISALKFVAIGRLSREKGLDVLIRALCRVKGDWRLDIFGGGPEYDTLAALIDACGLEGHVSLRGHIDNSYAAIDAADWLILPSRVEGFGVVLVEALARGVPAIASDCPHGPREILKDGRFGLLVQPDDVNALGEILCQVVDGRHEFDRDLLRERAMDFSVSRSVERWLELLRRTEKQLE